MKIKVVLGRKELELEFGKNERINVSKVLNKLNLQLPAIIVLRNGQPIPEDEELKDGDVLEIIDVHSGG